MSKHSEWLLKWIFMYLFLDQKGDQSHATGIQIDSLHSVFSMNLELDRSQSLFLIETSGKDSPSQAGSTTWSWSCIALIAFLSSLLLFRLAEFTRCWRFVCRRRWPITFDEQDKELTCIFKIHIAIQLFFNDFPESRIKKFSCWIPRKGRMATGTEWVGCESSKPSKMLRSEEVLAPERTLLDMLEQSWNNLNDPQNFNCLGTFCQVWSLPVQL